MKNSVKKELADYILDAINEGRITNEDRDDWHHILFNQDYYIIGYYDAEQWLKTHEIGCFEAIGICQEWEEDNFGEKQKQYDNAETTVNMLAYIYGEELLSDLDAENIDDLKQAVTEVAVS